MTRIFASLLLVVICGIFAIGWVSEQIWQQYSHSADNDIKQLAQFSQLIPQQLNQAKENRQQQKIQLEQVKKWFALQYNANVELIAIDDVAWPETAVDELNAGIAQLSFINDQQVIIHQPWLTQNKLIVIGPITLAARNHSLKQVLQISGYLLLALVILSWTWPLWRDLRKLQQASKAYAKGNFNHQLTINARSAVKPLALSFQSMAEQIATLIDEQKQLVNTVSHDLRTPLSRIKFSLAMLPNDVQAQLPEMQKDLDALEHLVDELLSYARLEHQSQSLNCDHVDIEQLLNNQVAQNRQHTDINIQLSCETPLIWYCDGHLLERVIQNILSNALRFAEKQITVTAQLIEQQLEITICDDGLGIKPADLETVFTPFARLDNNHKKSTGFGLGLAIVRKICRWHGGDCFASNNENGGAKFRIWLPHVASLAGENKKA